MALRNGRGSDWSGSSASPAMSLTVFGAVSGEEKVRRLVRRLEVPARDVPVILGMLRQILWKLEN
jgi:hypothetical protein